MVITPNSKIKLIKNPLKLDSNNEITFSNATTQYNYFNSLPKLEFDNLTYIRKDNILRIETDDNLTFEDLLGYNFCMYQNTHFDNKWFYAFITDITWINPSLTEIKIETAYFQTWQFDLIYMDSFIEREHVDDDTIGIHTIPEDLETGDYFPSEQSIMNYGTLYANPYYVCAGVSENILDNNSPVLQYNRIYSGIQYLVIRDEISLNNFIKKYDNAGKNEAISCLFMIPGAFIDNGSAITWSVVDNIHYKSVTTGEDSTTIKNLSISRPSQIGISSNKYTPKNNKLYTENYMYILYDNMCGSTAKYCYEYFSNPNECTFQCIGAITPGCSLQTHPLNYKGLPSNISEGVLNAKLPICSWNSDIYTNWLTQNGVNRTIAYVTSGLQIAGGLLLSSSGAGSIMGGSQVASGALNIANLMGQKHEHSIAPDQAKGNINNGDVIFAHNRFYPTFYKMSIKEEYAKAIDDYWSMFGYKVNRLGKPHIKARTYYDYIKTVNINIEGNIPETDLIKIREMFDNGIRFWHNTTHYLDFSVNNTIIS